MSVTYHVVVPFDRSDDGLLQPGEAQEAPNPALAERRARSLAAAHAGAVAFSRAGEPATGEFGDPTVLGVFGEVVLDALSE